MTDTPKIQGGPGFSVDALSQAIGSDFSKVEEAPEEQGGDESIAEEEDTEEGGEEEVGEEDSSAEEEEEREEEEQEEEKEKPAQKRKSLTARLPDGTEVKVPLDAKVQVKVDGEIVEIPLSEALDNISGTRAISKRFAEIDREKKAIEQERTTFLQYRAQKEVEEKEFIAELMGHVQQGKPEGALAFLAEVAGKNPVEFWKSFLVNSLKYAEHFVDADPRQVELYFEKLAIEHERKKIEKEREKEKKQKTDQQFFTWAAEVLKLNNLTDEEFQSSLDEIHEEKRLNTMPREDALRTVVEHALRKKHEANVLRAIMDVDRARADDTRLIELVMSSTNPHEYGVEDLREIVAGVLEVEIGKATASANRRAYKNGVRPQAATREKVKTGKPKTYRNVGEMLADFGFSRK